MKKTPATMFPQLAAVAHQQTLSHAGVVRMRKGWGDVFFCCKTPGIRAWSDSQGWLNVRVSVVAGQESNLYQLGLQIQNAVRTGIREVSREPLGRVDVIVAEVATVSADWQSAREAAGHAD